MTISQPLNNASLAQQAGGGFVAKTSANFVGGDALIGFSASAWSQSAGPISLELWLDDQPTNAQLTLYANVASTHMALGHAWAWCAGVPAGEHAISLLAGETTMTDENDYACVTVWDLGGGGGAVRFSEDVPCPAGTGQQLISAEVLTEGAPLLISGSASGWAETAGDFITGWMPFDGGDPIEMQVYPNNAEQHLAMVATDRIFVPQNRGEHRVQLNADGLTSTDSNDTAHLTVVELLEDGSGPGVLAQLQNVTANTQDGFGATIAETTFQSGGGPLLVRTALSVWTQQQGPLGVGIQVDGTSQGFAQIYANQTTMHMPTVVNDLVITGVPAGPHTLNLMAEANVITDLNDRVSVLILEFP